MAHSNSRAAVVRAILGNALVTLAKAAAWLVTGSGAMLAETFHSLVDTLNQGLLLIGQKRSLLAPTRRHPFGFGPEASFWGLLAAIGILVFGGGLSIQHGLHGLVHPEVPRNLEWALGV
ncbi:MAG: cation transporter, partial [Myxococcales bacterium]|nr:cation transporter [Myxococcales bacterium]